jgi:hypothetical protein
LVVLVAEVTEQAEWSYERGKFGATASELRRLAEMVPTAEGAGSGEGVYRAIWETDLGHAGAVLDAGEAATGRRRARAREHHVDSSQPNVNDYILLKIKRRVA